MAAAAHTARLRALLLALLALALCAPATASADHGRWGDAPPEWSEDEDGDEGYEDPWPDDVGQPDIDQAGEDPWADVDESAVPWDPSTGDWERPAPVQPAEPARPAQPALPAVPVPRGRTVKGRRAYMRADGRAAIPRAAPKRVKVAIAAANKIIGKPYKWGGGHARLIDSGYDCSGSVSYALIRSNMLGSPLVSGSLARWGSAGAGRWITVYANRGHVYMEVAGLRLDTSSYGDVGRRSGVRWRPAIGRRSGFTARHPAGL